jgi:hypothetical protein
MTENTPTADRGGRGGRGRGRSAGRGRNNRRGSQRPLFHGKIKDLGVFETAGERSDSGRTQNQFVETLKALKEYAAQNLSTKEGKSTIVELLRNMKPYAPVKPTRPTKDKDGDYDKFETDDYWAAMNTHRKAAEAFKEGQITMWAVIWGQTSKKMQLNLEAKTGYEAMENESDILELLKEVKIVSYKFDVHRKEEESLSMAIKELASYRQGNLSIDDYYKEFNSRCGVIEQFGGTVGSHPVVTARHLAVPVNELRAQFKSGAFDSDEYFEAVDKGVESYKIHLWMGELHDRYEPLMTELRNRFSQGEDLWPKTMDAAYKRLVTYVVPGASNNRNRTGSTNRERTGSTPTSEDGPQLSFVQQGGTRTRGQNDFPAIQCYNCQSMGHYADDCTSAS